MYKFLQRIICNYDGYTVPRGTRGIVVRTDNERSLNGFNTLVVWKSKLGRRWRYSWIPAEALAPI